MSTSFFFCSCLRGGIRHELHKGSRLRHGLSTAASFTTDLESAASQREYASPRTLKRPPSRQASPLASQRRQSSPRAPQWQNISLWALQRQRTSPRSLPPPSLKASLWASRRLQTSLRRQRRTHGVGFLTASVYVCVCWGVGCFNGPFNSRLLVMRTVAIDEA